MALDLLILFLIFVGGSLLSSYLMRRAGYRVPTSLKTREDRLLLIMKLLTFSMLTCIFLAVVMLLGLDPLRLMPDS